MKQLQGLWLLSAGQTWPQLRFEINFETFLRLTVPFVCLDMFDCVCFRYVHFMHIFVIVSRHLADVYAVRASKEKMKEEIE